MQRVLACLTNDGFAPSRHPANAAFAYGGFPHVTARIHTDAGFYEIVIFPTAHEAFAYAYQQTSLPGASVAPVHGSYQGRVSLVSGAAVKERGDESHAYYVERSAIAACAFSIPAATGTPGYVY